MTYERLLEILDDQIHGDGQGYPDYSELENAARKIADELAVQLSSAIRHAVAEHYDCPAVTGHGPLDRDVESIIAGVMQRLNPLPTGQG